MGDRVQLLSDALELKGRPYVWGAKGPEQFDCSGFVTYLIHRMGGYDWRQTHNAAALWRDCESIPEADLHLDDITKGAPLWPCPGVDAGDLAFYGPEGEPDHVMLVWGDGQVLGASGGNHHTTSPEIAAQLGACVRFRPRVDYRPDFLGYRRFPLPVSLEG